MRMSIQELASAAEQRRSERHRRQQEAFEGIDLEVLEEIQRMPSIDADLRADLADWIVQVKRQVKVDLDQKEVNASSLERLALPVMVVVFGVGNWVAQTLELTRSTLVLLQIVAFGICATLWWIARSEALEAIKSVRKRQAFLGKVE